MVNQHFNQQKSIKGKLSTKKSYLDKNIKVHPKKLLINEEFNLFAFTEIISAYTNHKFNHKLKISNKNTITDAIATGINFLGEELQNTTISRDYFSNIYNAVSEVLIVINKKGYITDVNKATVDLLEIKKDNLIHSDARKLIQTNIKQLRKEITDTFKIGNNFHSFESKFKNASNKCIPVHCTLSKIFDLNKVHHGYLFIAKNISEQKEREIQERRLVLNEIEKERIRLSRDMHDSLGQEINAVKLYMNSLSYMDSSKDDYKEVIEICKNLLNRSIETVQHICFNLMPQSLEQGGLIYACYELVQKLNPICKIEYDFPKSKIKLSNENQTILFRIIQEFISNSLKHSNCKKIELIILKNKNEIQISINDNGKGFNINKVLKGNGLNNILSRIEVLQIRYDFKSQIKKGTSLKLFINVKKSKNTIS